MGWRVITPRWHTPANHYIQLARVGVFDTETALLHEHHMAASVDEPQALLDLQAECAWRSLLDYLEEHV